MADKQTQLVLDALTRAAAEPGAPLFAARHEPGLFPATAAAKPAAKRCLDDGLLSATPDGKQARLTDAGLRFLAEQASPKQVLEDFVRVLERREAEVATLLAQARGMAESLQSLKATVAGLMPQVAAARVRAERVFNRLADWRTTAAQDCPLPELFRTAHDGSTIGEFHDALRNLHAGGQIYLHPWTGPLYAMPEPSFALLVGHEVAYYASSKDLR